MFPTIVPGATNQSVIVHIMDSTDGTPETGVDYNTAGIDLWYWRPGAAKTSITEAALASLDAAHSDGGIEHIADGDYRLDLPDAAVASGVPWVAVGGTVTGMIVIGTVALLKELPEKDDLASATEIATQASTQMTLLKNDTAGGPLVFTMSDSTTHQLATGKTVSGQVSIDGAAFGAVTGAISEIGLGWYKLAANATDRNGDMLAFHFTAEGCDAQPILVKTGS